MFNLKVFPLAAIKNNVPLSVLTFRLTEGETGKIQVFAVLNDGLECVAAPVTDPVLAKFIVNSDLLDGSSAVFGGGSGGPQTPPTAHAGMRVVTPSEHVDEASEEDVPELTLLGQRIAEAERKGDTATLRKLQVELIHKLDAVESTVTQEELDKDLPIIPEMDEYERMISTVR